MKLCKYKNIYCWRQIYKPEIKRPEWPTSIWRYCRPVSSIQTVDWTGLVQGAPPSLCRAYSSKLELIKKMLVEKKETSSRIPH